MNILDDWKIIHAKAPDDGRYVACIEGRVASTNPRFPGSSIIRTSYVVGYEMHDGAMLVITARRSEYLLGKRHPGEYLSEDFLKSFLSQRVNEPPLVFDAACSQIVGYAESEYEAPQSLVGTSSGQAGQAPSSPK